MSKIMKSQLGENKDELWDVLDRDRNATGKVHRRGDALADDEFHLVVHVCIFNSQGQLLIQKRQPWKQGWPNMWDLSAAGSAVAGDDSRKAAQREVKEELGIDLDLSKDRPKFSIYFEHGFDDYWIIEREIEIESLSLQYEEVADAKWVTKDEYSEMVTKREAIPYTFFEWMFDLSC